MHINVGWDPAKAVVNFRKHGVRFADAATVFTDPRSLTIEDRRFNEQRFVTMGLDALGTVLVVVYTYPEHKDVIRLISARRATRAEREQYDAQEY